MDNYDVCIVGGGTSGSMAAISCAKLGLKTIIVERMASLGGTSTNGLVMPSMPTYVGKTPLQRELEEQLKIYLGEIYSSNYLNELKNATEERPDEASTCMYFSKEAMEFSLEDLCTKYGVDIIYDATLVKTNITEGKITSVDIKATNDLVNIKASNFIDATGDAILSVDSGVKIASGNDENKNQFTSLRFEICNIDMDKFLNYMNNDLKQKYCKSDYPHYTFGVLHQNKEQVLEPLLLQAMNDGVISIEEYRWLQGFSIPTKGDSFTFNSPRIPFQDDVVNYKNKSTNYIKGRSMIRKFHQFLKLYVKGFENCAIGNIAPMLGVRESNRIIGQYILTSEDYNNRQTFEDGVVRADWWIDIHKNEHDDKDENRYKYQEYFEIPYRSLITNEVSNLIVIGRCISADFAAQASIRIQPQCRMMGEVAGYACLKSKELKTDLNKLDGKIIKDEMRMYE